MRKGTVGERVAVVERDVEQLLEDGLRREEKQEEILASVKVLAGKLDAIKAEQDRYKGFLGGVLWVLVAMGAIVAKLGLPIYTWVMKM